MPEIIDPLERAVRRCVRRGIKGRRWGSENQRCGSIRHQRQHPSPPARRLRRPELINVPARTPKSRGAPWSARVVRGAGDLEKLAWKTFATASAISSMLRAHCLAQKARRRQSVSTRGIAATVLSVGTPFIARVKRGPAYGINRTYRT